MRFWQNTSIRNKLLISLVIISVVNLLCANLFFYSKSINETMELSQKIYDIESHAASLNNSIQVGLVARNKNALQKILDTSQFVSSQDSVALLDKQGTILASTGALTKAQAQMQKQLQTEKIGNRSLKKSYLFDGSSYCMKRGLTSRGAQSGSIIYCETLDVAYKAQQQFFLLMLVAALLSILLANYLQRAFTSPIEHLIKSMRHISKTKDLHYRIDSLSKDEFGQMTTHFNNMLERIESYEIERDKAQERIVNLAYFHRTSEKPNRFLFKHDLDKLIKERAKGTIIFFEWTNFHRIAELLSEKGLRELTKQENAQMEACLAKYSWIHPFSISLEQKHRLAHIGDNYFACICLSQDEEAISELIEDMCKAGNKKYELEDHTIHLTFAYGATHFDRNDSSADVVTNNAKLACLAAANDKDGIFTYFSETMAQKASYVLSLEADLKEALDKNEIGVHYQPKFDMKLNKITGCEALMRWIHPVDGFIPPDIFIPMAERTGLIERLGNYILRQACLDCLSWRALGFTDMHVAVNVSPKQFIADDFVSHVLATLQETGLPASALELELTESMLINDGEDSTMGTLHNLFGAGITLSIDDFGTGYSSLQYLANLPINQLKIDRFFIDGVDHDKKKQTLTLIMLALAKNLDLQTVAEGVETQEEFQFLQANNCDMIQGYYICKPLPVKAFTEFLQGFGIKKAI